MSYVVDKLVMSTWQAEILTIQSSHVEPGRNVAASGWSQNGVALSESTYLSYHPKSIEKNEVGIFTCPDFACFVSIWIGIFMTWFEKTRRKWQQMTAPPRWEPLLMNMHTTTRAQPFANLPFPPAGVCWVLVAPQGNRSCWALGVWMLLRKKQNEETRGAMAPFWGLVVSGKFQPLSTAVLRHGFPSLHISHWYLYCPMDMVIRNPKSPLTNGSLSPHTWVDKPWYGHSFNFGNLKWVTCPYSMSCQLN